MTLENRKATDEAQSRRIMDDWTEALHAKDINRLWSHYTPDILSFDLAPPLQQHSGELRRGLEKWFETFRGPIGYEIRDLSLMFYRRLALSCICHLIRNRFCSTSQSSRTFRKLRRSRPGARRDSGE